MKRELESVAIKLMTEEGFPMAVGGICLPGTANYWEERLRELASLRVSGGDIYKVDDTLARAIRNIADETLLIAGCSLDARVGLTLGESTGGVLGCPRDTISSAPDSCEMLPEGFSMYTVAGGPGLAALADTATTERAAMAVQALGSVASGEAILDCIRIAGIDTFLLVSDGSGPEAHGCLAVASPGKSTTIIFLRERLQRSNLKRAAMLP
jgi:hypothetical protein